LNKLHFKPEEFACPCCGKIKVSHRLLLLLETIRRVYANPIIITSGFRCKKHNDEIGGSKRSKHLKGMAVDIKTKDEKDFDYLASVVMSAWRLYFNDFRVGIYRQNFIHLDVDDRSNTRFWLDYKGNRNKRLYFIDVYADWRKIMKKVYEDYFKEKDLWSSYLIRDL